MKKIEELQTLLEVRDLGILVSFLDDLSKMAFKPVTPSILDTIQAEGLDDEMGISDWEYTELAIPSNLSDKLKSFDNETLNLFNRFDIALKEKYDNTYIDLIDYDTGTVVVVRPSKA